jgi:hypothetical protein
VIGSSAAELSRLVNGMAREKGVCQNVPRSLIDRSVKESV